MTEETNNQAAQSEVQQPNPILMTPEEIADKVQEAINKIGTALEGTPMDVAFAALIDTTCGALTAPIFDNDTKKAGTMFLLGAVAQVSLINGLTEEEVRSAMTVNQNAEAPAV